MNTGRGTAGNVNLQNFINGRFRDARSGATREFFNPADNSLLGHAAESGVEDVGEAVAAAREAFDNGPWSRTPAVERAARLFKLADLVEAHAEELAALDTRNNGKPLREARFDAADSAACFRYYAGLATKPQGQVFEVGDPNIVCQTVREPIGVCGQIIPWNYPLLMAAWKLAPGLAAGNCCILKPSELTPLSVVRLFELIDETGFPPGVVQLVLGAGDPVGAALASHHAVDKIAFTGGGVTGRKILAAAAGNLKKVSLELGGKSPNILFADTDPGIALEFAMFGIFAGQGEVCSAGSRLLIEKSMAEDFLPRLAAACGKIVVGDGMEEGTEMGPLISRPHQAKVLQFIEAGVAEGARLLCGGGAYADHRQIGNFVEPTVFVNTRPEMRIVREEIFGPVLAVQTFESEEEAVRVANDTPYGLAGAVFTQDGSRAQRVIRRLRAGITWINTYHPTFPEAPWGGYKQSGIGRELGTYGFEAYTEVKQINTCLAPQKTGWFKGLAS
ncbi:MAG: aldehyde dehydrogenase family protein [Terrimicrobiaceae bacterium]|nr:aldehyde dehydrogenase family protein [Terrimicrobiaceae bacterium]